MSEIFVKIVNMSISASWLVLAVLILRLLLKRAPRWVNVLLWGIVALRLICPAVIVSDLSLVPSSQTIPENFYVDTTPAIDSGVDAIDSVVNPAISYFYDIAPQGQDTAMVLTAGDFAIVWLVGVLLMVGYTAVSYLILRRSLRTAVRLRENLYQCETVSSPFVLGLIRPKIYLPYGMEDAHVIAHERAHIRRLDHWWKPLGFLLLSIHWFNPIMWLAYLLLCRDIELACDEKVISQLGNGQRADYSQALLACSVNRRSIAACPLAFGEVGVKERVKSIMNYRKPGFWLVVTAIAVCIAVSVCFLTDPKPSPEFAMGGENVADLDPAGIVDRIIRYQDMEYDNAYVNANNFSLTVDGNFDWVDSQAVRYFYYEDQNVRSGQLRIFPQEQAYFLTESEPWPDQNRIFLLRHYLDALKYLPQDAIRALAPADRYLIEHIDGGSPTGFDRVITYSALGPGPTDGWYLHLRLIPLHEEEEGYTGGGDEAVHLFYGAKAVEGAARVWFDYSADPELMDWNMEREYTIEEFPGITFTCNPYEINVGEQVLIHGMPIWNAYLYDLTGDGCPEICAETSFGSGIIDNRILAYDYAAGVEYSLDRRMICDYFLGRNEDGSLRAEKRSYFSGALIHSGQLVIRDGMLTIQGEAPANLEIVAIDDPTRDPDFSYDSAMEVFYQDEHLRYLFAGIYSDQVIVHYKDGTTEGIVSAMEHGRATLTDLDRFRVNYWAEEK